MLALFWLAGTGIAAQTGVIEQLARIFYWPNTGDVAGEYTVKMAAGSGSSYDQFCQDNYNKVTTFEQRKDAYIQDNGEYWRNSDGTYDDLTVYEALWAGLEKNNRPLINAGVTAVVDGRDLIGNTIANGYRAMKHPNIDEANKQKISDMYVQLIQNANKDGGLNTGNLNNLIVKFVGLYLFLQDNPQYNRTDFIYTSNIGWLNEFAYKGVNYETEGTNYNLFDFLEGYISNTYDRYVSDNLKTNEFDSREYMPPHINAALMIYDFAKSQELKNKAKMATDLLLLDMAMDFSANQWGGVAGVRETAQSYFTTKKENVGYHCILLGLGCAFPARYKPAYSVYLTTYRPPAVLVDAVDISDESDAYWHQNMEYNEGVHQPGKGKMSFVTKYYNLSGGYRRNWRLNIKADDTIGTKHIGVPFNLQTINSTSYLGLGGEFYQYRNALLAPGNNLSLSVWKHDSASWDYYQEENGRYYLQKGKTMVILDLGGILEVAIQGVDYPSMTEFKTNFKGGNTTSKGVKIGSNTNGDTLVNDQAVYNYPFKRLETIDNKGDYIIKWNNKVMTLNKHGKTCVYNFNNWTASEDCGGGDQPGGAVCGNGIREGTEECDDGNQVETDACSNSCIINASNPCPYNLCQSGDNCSQWYQNDAAKQCCVTACTNNSNNKTNFNPSYPRVAMQRPIGPESNYALDANGNCVMVGPSDGATSYIFSKYDLVAFQGLSNGCTKTNFQEENLSDAVAFAKEIKQYSPETIVLGRPTSPINLGRSAPVGYYAMKNKTATLKKSVKAGASELSLSDVSFFYSRTNKPDFYRANFAFIGTDSFDYQNVDYTQNLITGVTGIDRDNQAGEIVKQPLEVFSQLPNLTPVNNLADYKQVAKFIVDNRYEGITKEDIKYFDGIFYSEIRDSVICADDMCANPDWGVDFDNNGVRDCQCGGPGGGIIENLTGVNEQWHTGITEMFQYERQVLNKLFGPNKDIIVVNNGAPAEEYMANLVNGFQLEYFSSWNSLLHSIIRYWDKNAIKPHASVFIDQAANEESGEAIKTARNNFSEMRYGLTTAIMGDAFYGRNFGGYHYIGLWYDEYETDLGYPLNDMEPAILESHCSTVPWHNDFCVYVRFFDKGAVILNGAESDQTITGKDLRDAWVKVGFNIANYPGYYKFLGGQDGDFNNGERVSFPGIGPANEDTALEPVTLKKLGDGALLFINPTTAVADIVVGNWPNDDTTPGSEPVQLSPSDQWHTIDYSAESRGANPYYTQWVAGWTPEGKPYFYTDGPGKTATFRPTIGVPGGYEVYEWHGWHADRGDGPETYSEASNIKAIIKHAEGAAEATVDQTKNYGQWNYLGAYQFSAGQAGYVQYQTDSANGVVIADAVMFRFTDNSGGGDIPPDTGTNKADLNCSQRVDIIDLGIMMSCWMGAYTNDCAVNAEPAQCQDPDLNEDTLVDVQDFSILLSCWGSGVSPRCSGNLPPTPPPTPPPGLITNLQPNNYQLGTIRVNEKYYIDRDYVLTSVPLELDGLAMIKTANDDKKQPTSSTRITFDLNNDAIVYILHDERAPLTWLSSQGFGATNLVTSVSDPYYLPKIFSKSFTAGKVELPGNGCLSETCSNYAVIIKPNQ